MSDILVRNLDPKILKRLKEKAKKHGRSLQGEVKAILLDAAAFSVNEMRAISDELYKKFKGRTFSDSAEIIREDRER